MKYLSLDLETTCLQPSPEHILQLSMVVEDTARTDIPVEDLPELTFFVRHARISGEAFALSMNGWILDILSGRAKLERIPLIYNSPDWISDALAFMDEHFGDSRITVAGKNVAGFDIPFLPKEISKRFRHKVLDPATLFVDWSKDDQVPNFELCKQRAGLPGPVAHDALEDARDVIRLLRVKYCSEIA